MWIGRKATNAVHSMQHAALILQCKGTLQDRDCLESLTESYSSLL